MTFKKIIPTLVLSASLCSLSHMALADHHGYKANATPNGKYGAEEVSKTNEAGAETITEALLEGEFSGSLRYRYQFLDDAGFDNDAHASTIRALLKYETKPFYGVSVLGEVRTVQRIGAGDLHNDTLNGNTDRPVIADPDSREIDQLLVRFDQIIPDTSVTVGRRKINLNNQRFISTLGFRQTGNSFDGIVVENESLPNTKLHYSYANNVNRAFTDDSPVGNFDGDIHLLHGETKLAERHKLVGYGYFLGIEEGSFAGASNLATNTYGVNLKGWEPLSDDWSAYYDLEYAYQTENTESSLDIDLSYYRIQPGVKFNNFRINVGYEVLEGDGTVGFSTPLALLHAFNGYADVFLVTPPDGLEDAYINATYWVGESPFKIAGYDVLGKTKLHVAYHDFSAENSSIDYGTEFDVSIKKKLTDNLTLALEYANYDADFNGAVTPASPSFQRDREQFYTALIYKF